MGDYALVLFGEQLKDRHLQGGPAYGIFLRLTLKKPDIFEESGEVKGTSELVKCPSFFYMQLIKAFNSPSFFSWYL